MYICIAGKNECSINAIKTLTKYKINKKYIYVLPNFSDNGRNNWQPSLRRFARKNRFKIVKLKELYSIPNLIFFSLEYETIINVDKFRSKNFLIFILVYYQNTEDVIQIFYKFLTVKNILALLCIKLIKELILVIL